MTDNEKLLQAIMSRASFVLRWTRVNSHFYPNGAVLRILHSLFIQLFEWFSFMKFNMH